MPVGQFNTPSPDKVIQALMKLGNQRPTGINLRVPNMVQHYLGTWLGAEAVDSNLSLVRLHGGDTIRFVPKMDGLTLVAGDIIKLEESSALKLHIVGKIVGNITLASNAAFNVAKPGAPTSYSHGTAGTTTISVSWSAGVDHFGSGLHYQVYVNGVFKTATGTGVLSASLTGLTAGKTYQSYVIAIDGAGNQSVGSNQISWTMAGVPPDDPGVTVTKTYKALAFRSYNYNGHYENDDWHEGNAYQGNDPGSGANQLGLIFFNDQAIRNDTAGNEILSCKATLTFAHWYYNNGGVAIVGTHEYRSGHAPGTVSTSNLHNKQSRNSVAGKAFTVDFGAGVGEQFRDGGLSGVSVGQGTTSSLTYYGYTYGLGTHVPYLVISYIQT